MDALPIDGVLRRHYSVSAELVRRHSGSVARVIKRQRALHLVTHEPRVAKLVAETTRVRGKELCVLGMADAALDHKDEAIREGRRAV